ncbi:outer membrane beta-barrel protein [Vibrio amylolyticus]|uniref:outer membrane beta-barrel protein n=1 Tax=Vibrio amylolyticus TaxID=2847292 RepID=UPI00354F7842
MMIKRWIAFTFLFLFTGFSAMADEVPNGEMLSSSSINYDYFYADLSSGSYDETLGVNSNVTALAVGFSTLYRQNWLLGFDYSARFTHRDTETDEYYTIQPAIGYRFELMPNFELSPRVKVGFKRLNVVVDDTDVRLFRHDDFIYGGDLKAAYQLTKKLELAAVGELIRSEHFDENILTLRGDYRISQSFTLGGFYTHRDMKSNTTNEGGISLRFYY